jgi:hypothetical protein
VGPAIVPGSAGSKRFKPFPNLNGAKTFNFSNFDQSRRNLPELQEFEIKYSSKDLEKINKFVHRNFFRFGRDFE